MRLNEIKHLFRQHFQNDLFLMFFLAGLALSLRIIFFNGLNWDDDPDYVHRAYQVAFESKFVFPDNNGLRIGTYYPTALFYHLFGISQATIALFSLILSFLSAAVLFRFGTRFFNRSVGILAVLLFSVYPLDVELSSRLLPDPILPAISLFAVYLLFTADKINLEQPTNALRRKFNYLTSGALVAYLPAVNMSAFPILLFFVLYLVVHSVTLFRGANNPHAWRNPLGRLVLFGLGFLFITTAENLLYLHQMGDFFFKYKATLYHYNVEQTFHPNLCTYPDLMFQLRACSSIAFKGWADSYYGFHYLALLAVIIPGLVRYQRWYVWIFIWFIVVFGYLQFGSMSLSEYHPLHRLPRHLDMITPAMILLLAGGFDVIRSRRFIGSVLSLSCVGILIFASLIVIVARHNVLKDDVLPQIAVHSFIRVVKPKRIYSTENTIAYQRFLEKFNGETKYSPLRDAMMQQSDGYVVLGEFRNSEEIARSNNIFGIPLNWDRAYSMDVELHNPPQPQRVTFYRVQTSDILSLRDAKRANIIEYIENVHSEEIMTGESVLFWWECAHVDGVDDVLISNTGEVAIEHFEFEMLKDVTYAYLTDYHLEVFYDFRLIVDEQRGEVKIAEMPSMDNNYTLRIHIDDGEIPESGFYRFFIVASTKSGP